MTDSIPSWRTEGLNPYQSPFPDEFLDDGTRQYEAALETHEGLIRELRDRVRELEGENERLKWQLASPPRHLMRPPVIRFFGFHMESADMD